MVVMGGNADLWGYGLGWDVLTHKLIGMCRAQGIPTVDGAQYFRALERPQGICIQRERKRTTTST